MHTIGRKQLTTLMDNQQTSRQPRRLNYMIVSILRHYFMDYQSHIQITPGASLYQFDHFRFVPSYCSSRTTKFWRTERTMDLWLSTKMPVDIESARDSLPCANATKYQQEVETVRRCNKGSQHKRICNATLQLFAGHYLYTYQPGNNSSCSKGLGNRVVQYSNVHEDWWIQRTTEVLQSKITTDEDLISNVLSLNKKPCGQL